MFQLSFTMKQGGTEIFRFIPWCVNLILLLNFVYLTCLVSEYHPYHDWIATNDIEIDIGHIMNYKTYKNTVKTKLLFWT